MHPEIKMGLEEEARAQGLRLAELLDRMALQIIENGHRKRDVDEAEQARIHAAAAKCFGAFAAGPNFSENVREKVRARVRERFARNRPA
jgi:hypothetical protein